MNNYIIYARKSSEADDRQALSIESQLSEIKNVVEKRNLSVSQTLTEQKSAKSPGRPQFNQMIQLIESGKVVLLFGALIVSPVILLTVGGSSICLISENYKRSLLQHSHLLILRTTSFC
jgi:hypothetical protein